MPLRDELARRPGRPPRRSASSSPPSFWIIRRGLALGQMRRRLLARGRLRQRRQRQQRRGEREAAKPANAREARLARVERDAGNERIIGQPSLASFSGQLPPANGPRHGPARPPPVLRRPVCRADHHRIVAAFVQGQASLTARPVHNELSASRRGRLRLHRPPPVRRRAAARRGGGSRSTGPGQLPPQRAAPPGRRRRARLQRPRRRVAGRPSRPRAARAPSSRPRSGRGRRRRRPTSSTCSRRSSTPGSTTWCRRRSRWAPARCKPVFTRAHPGRAGQPRAHARQRDRGGRAMRHPGRSRRCSRTSRSRAGALAALEPDRLLVFCDEDAPVADPVAGSADAPRNSAAKLAVLVGPGRRVHGRGEGARRSPATDASASRSDRASCAPTRPRSRRSPSSRRPSATGAEAPADGPPIGRRAGLIAGRRAGRPIYSRLFSNGRGSAGRAPIPSTEVAHGARRFRCDADRRARRARRVDRRGREAEGDVAPRHRAREDPVLPRTTPRPSPTRASAASAPCSTASPRRPAGSRSWTTAIRSASPTRDGGGAISLEPGGQFELSGAPLADLHETAARDSTAHLAAGEARRRAARHRLPRPSA